MPEEQAPRRVRFCITEAPGFRSVPASGIWGSIGPGVIIHAIVYQDLVATPGSYEAPISDEGQLIEQHVELANTEGGVAGTIMREGQVRLMLTPEAAVSMGEWLTRQGHEALEKLASNFVAADAGEAEPGETGDA